jgi:carboxyl-terminal processing protease
MKSLIIDLRGNAGGVLTASIEAANLFLNEGIIVRTKSRGVLPEDVHSAMKTTLTWDIPLAVLIDKDSASASEIFAGAILDNNRGWVVGQPSFGKDTVQMVISLTGGKPHGSPVIAGLKLTTETYYSPKGNSFYGIGVQPNILVPDAVPSIAPNTAVPYLVSKPSGDDGSDRGSRQQILREDQVLKTAIDTLQRQTQADSLTQYRTLMRYQPSVN